ncbi:MAG: glycosyltransferase [Sedimentisphaerales bacterium]
MFDVKKFFQGYGAVTTPTSRLAIYSPRFGGAYRSSISLPLTTDSSAKICIALITAMIIYSGFLTLADFRAMLEELRMSRTGWMFFYSFRALLLSNVIVFLWRVLLVLGYRPVRSCTDEQLPRCTVIVPAYNEGKHMLKTLRSVLKSDYPINKLQIIAINDGSADDTLSWIQKACAESAGRIEMINFKKNRGKRAALYEGIIRGRGDIVVTIDSDSIIERQTIRRLVSPFVSDSKIGAVAGSVRVLNRRDGIIPKMLEVSFAYSFDFIRASQSMVNTVFCTPGALSAYRKSVVIKDLKDWVHQTFLGQPATIGEDRAITNIVLKNGYDVRFQSNAVVYTMVPTEYGQLCKMLLRWSRSNVRETWVMVKFMFKKFRKDTSGARVNFIVSFINPVVSRILVFAVAGWMLVQPSVYLSQVLFGAVIASTAPAVFYLLRRRSSEAIWSYAYGLFWLSGLWWISIWAVLTMRNGKWLTRDLPAGKTPISDRLMQLFRLRAA